MFVLHHDDYDTIQVIPDLLDTNPYDEHKLLEKVSPVTLFILNKDNKLEVVAIQKDVNPGTEATGQRCSVNHVLKNFAKFTGKHLRWSLFLSQVDGMIGAKNFCRANQWNGFYMTRTSFMKDLR